MKQLNKNILFIAILGLFTACTSSNEHLLVENMPITTSTNFATDIFTGGQSFAMFQDSLLVGYGNGYAYSTPDFFQNTLAAENAEREIHLGEFAYRGFPELIKRVETDSTVELKYSNNFGKTYTPMFTFPRQGPNGRFGYGFNFISGTEGWLCKTYKTIFSLTPDSVKLYKINGQTITFLANLKTNYQFTSSAQLHFLDSQRGWALYTNSNGSIYYLKYTSDGGLTWTGNTSFSESLTSYIQNGRLFLKSGDYPYALYTSESETFSTYEKTPISQYLGYIYMVNSQIGYSISDNVEIEIHKTTDGAKTWTTIHTVPKNIYQYSYGNLDIQFKDELTGFFMLEDQLFYTKDGGINWRVGIYDAP